jgi:4-methylaminobutanoate oxidase (formaldehyde-forming)
MTKEQSLESFPTQAQVVVIGGGIIGCSVAYHLTKLGWKDVVLLERAQLTAGTTWHAAGLVTYAGFITETPLKMAHHSMNLYERLGEETGQETGFKSIGKIDIASTEEQANHLRRGAAFARNFGIEMQNEISFAEVKEMWPLLDTSGLVAAFYTPRDGRTNPVDTTMALAKGAKMGGARILEETKVTGTKQAKGRVTGVVTDKGEIEAEYVVNCGGMWAREVGKLAGVNVPLHAAEHYYLITEPIEGLQRDLPILEDPDRFAYSREEVGGLLLGVFEPVAAPWAATGIPENFNFGEIHPDWDRIGPYLETALERIPVAQHAGVHKLFCGPESFTPDLNPMMGEAPELRNFYVAAGFNSLGILLGGGAGQIMAQWIVDGLPPVNVWEIDIARMAPFQNNPQYLHDRTVEILGVMFSDEPFQTARNVCRSPFHDRLTQAGASFTEYAGWEYPDWFETEDADSKDAQHLSGREAWFEYVAAEHRATRESVTMMDVTVMAKLLVQGRDAEKILNRVCANNAAVPVGHCVYTQWLNERGTIEADLTVNRLSEDSYLILVNPLILAKCEAWLKRHAPPEAHVFITNVMLNVHGPKSRQLLSSLTSADMSNEAFPYMTVQTIDIGYALVNALRVSFVGELGWELYIPTEFSLHVFDRLVEAGGSVGLRHAGIYAMETLRLEKAYRDYGTDTTNKHTPLEVGLGFAVDFDKPGGFIGKDALLRQEEQGLQRRLVQFLLEDPEPLLQGGETIFRNGERVGILSVAEYGHTLGGAVGLGDVENEEGVSAQYVTSGTYEIESLGVRYPAKAALRPMVDPNNERVRS